MTDALELDLEAFDAAVQGRPDERRRRRSVDPLVAMHHQLSHVRTDADLDAIVVSDASGVVVAGAGAWATCEELAAFAPLLAQPEEGESDSLSSRLSDLRKEVSVRSLQLDGQAVFVCARGGRTHPRRLGLERAAEGVSRILTRPA